MKIATLLLLGLCVLGTTVGAAPWIWDAQPGNSQADDGGGTWAVSAANTNWWNQTQNVTWPNTTADTAVFGANSGMAGAITVGGTVTAGGPVG